VAVAVRWPLRLMFREREGVRGCGDEHMASRWACFEIARDTLRGLRFHGTHLGGLIKRRDAWQRSEGHN
jgi:hypothetical protein